jgi:predicted TPR repeat methyltransferase
MFAEAIRRRDWAQARGFAANMVRANPNSAPAHARLADMMERTGDSRAALNEYRASLRLDPRNAGYLHRLAALQQSTGDRAGAIQSFRQILAINPGDQGAQARLRALGVSP